jgi:hypothetical protein
MRCLSAMLSMLIGCTCNTKVNTRLKVQYLGYGQDWDRSLRGFRRRLSAVQVADVMAKVAEQVREAQDEAERRAPILEALQGIAAMRTECAWLASYEADEGRFKV